MPAQELIEVWRRIPGFEAYEVSDLGRIRRQVPEFGARGKRLKRHGRCLRGWPSKKGYRTVELCTPEGHFSRLVHCLVALAFIGPKPDGYEVNHKDTNKRNNRLDNLEYLTPLENTRHGRANGCWGKDGSHYARGSRSPRARINEAQALEIRQSMKKNPTKKEAERLAAKFVVGLSCIYHIHCGRSWKHI